MSEIRSGFNEFCRRLNLKWHFRDASENFSEVPVLTPKYRRKPPQDNHCLEFFLSQVENGLSELLKTVIKYPIYQRRSGWSAIRYLSDDRNIILKKADKGLCIIIWGWNDYLMEAEKQLRDEKVCQSCYIMSQDDQLTRIALHLRKKRLECLDYHLKRLMQRAQSPRILF